MDPNKLRHIFGKAAHGLDEVVHYYGSQEDAFRAIEAAAQEAVNTRKLTGGYPVTVTVASWNVTVIGKVIEGVARIGAAFIS